ncbi:hypothetical protein [Lacrimispora sp.]|uniref:hypothetical protein n=1 Tax=Lacrimispora sp. TaxID=2719234 RepID=UPI0028A9ED44|nr:hypothetical protein [Lacrimispora sp.]
MTIIDFMRKKLSEYPKIQEFLAGEELHIDFTDPDATSYGLSSAGDTLVKGDILGNQQRRHSFLLFAVCQSFTDYCRLANSNFLLELAYWLEMLPEEDGIHAEIDGKTLNVNFLKATTANAMAMQPMGATVNDGILYQIQIYAYYEIEMEEF